MKKYATIIIGIIAVVALVLSLSMKSHAKTLSVSDQVINSGVLKIGYIIYPPLLEKDPTTGQLSGVSYDLVEAAAKNLGLKTDWVEEVGWGTAIQGLQDNRYDIVGTEMWPNSARAREAVFSTAPMNSTIYPYVRTGDTRFNNLANINSSNVTIGVLDGEMAQFIAAEDYPNAKTDVLPQLDSYGQVFQDLLSKKADIVFVEPSVADDFLKTNPGAIERVNVPPIRTLGNSFAFARGQDSMVDMWNIAMNELITNGTVAQTLQKYGVASEYSINK